MAEKKTISAREVVADIKVGMTDEQLMTKYGLSAKGLESLKSKLLASGRLTQEELKRRSSPTRPSYPSADTRDPAPRIGSADQRPAPPILVKITVTVFVASLVLATGYAILPEEKGQALIAAAKAGDVTAVKRLMAEGADDVNAIDKLGFTAEMHASRNGHEEVVRLFQEKAAQKEARHKRYLLLQQALHCNLPGVERLLAEGADVNTKDGRGRTALIEFISYSETCYDAVRVMLSAGGNVNAQDNDGVTALMLACGLETATQKADRIRAHALETAKSSPELGGLFMRNATMQKGPEGIVRILLENGADLNAKDKDGRTALDYARGRGNEEVAKLLQGRNRR